MRAFISAICLAEDLGRPLAVTWDCDSHCGAPFRAIFDVENLPLFVSVSDGLRRPSKEVRTPEDVTDYFSLPPSIPIIIHSHQAFYDVGGDRWLRYLRRYLKPEFFTQTLFDTRIARVPPGPRVGVHIRRTDHQKAILHSPTEAFVAAMKKCSEDTIFILATDSEKEVERLKEEFPGRIVCLAIVNERWSPLGVKNAIVDLLGLASSRKIFGSYGSSFSEIAALYGGVELEVILDKNGAK